MKIVVIGGGYAGLACLIELNRLLPDSERILVDPRDRTKAKTLFSTEDLGRKRKFLDAIG